MTDSPTQRDRVAADLDTIARELRFHWLEPMVDTSTSVSLRISLDQYDPPGMVVSILKPREAFRDGFTWSVAAADGTAALGPTLNEGRYAHFGIPQLPEGEYGLRIGLGLDPSLVLDEELLRPHDSVRSIVDVVEARVFPQGISERPRPERLAFYLRVGSMVRERGEKYLVELRAPDAPANLTLQAASTLLPESKENRQNEARFVGEELFHAKVFLLERYALRTDLEIAELLETTTEDVAACRAESDAFLRLAK